MQRSGSYANKEDFMMDANATRFENAMAEIINEHGPEKKGKHSFKVKVLKWQKSSLGDYYEFQIQVEFLEGNALLNLTQSSFIATSRGTEPKDVGSNSFTIDSSIFKWVVYKRYTNFEDLHGQLVPYF